MMIAMVVIWGLNYSVIKIALSDVPPFTFNALRFSLATLIMVILLMRRGESLRLPRHDLLPVIVLGLAGHALYQIFFIGGLARTTPANSALLLATLPIWVVIYGQLTGVERSSREVWLGIVVSFIGIILLVLGGGDGVNLSASTLTGDLMTLLAAMLWAGYSTISKPLLVRHSPVKITTMQMLIGTPLLIALGLPGVISQNWTAVPAVAWGAVLYSAVLSTVVGYVLWTIGLKRAGNARTAIYSNVTPVVAVVAAWVLLGERLQPGQLVGAVIVLAGLVLTRRGKTISRQVVPPEADS
jgi:drug/metabolite transporter (DMT)-like permease